jgi:hypothetical protein
LNPPCLSVLSVEAGGSEFGALGAKDKAEVDDPATSDGSVLLEAVVLERDAGDFTVDAVVGGETGLLMLRAV